MEFTMNLAGKNKMTNKTFLLCATLLSLLAGTLSADETYEIRTFRKIVLTTTFYAEGSGYGDFNKDGKMDAVYGPHWYEGPDFKNKHALYPVKPFKPTGYSNNFITMVNDVNSDGYDDILVNEWPGKAVHWFENPRGKTDGEWKKHLMHPAVDNESPRFDDITGDGKPELIFHTGGRLGYARPGADLTQPWRFFPISSKEKWGRYQHGLGFGDVNGDKKADFMMVNGWWEQPAGKEPAEPGAATNWKKHAVRLGTKGGAHMYTYDVDGDGDMDIIASMDAHNYGLAWLEQERKDGNISFKKHLIMGSKPEDNAYGLRFSQMHAVCLVDMDGDGLKDIITGKRYWAHGPKGDSEPDAPAVLYWFKLVRSRENGVHYIPYQIDNDSGVGTQFTVGDLTGDGNPDVVTGNKKGGYVFIQEVKKVGKDEWLKAQPKRLSPK